MLQAEAMPAMNDTSMSVLQSVSWGPATVAEDYYTYRTGAFRARQHQVN